MSSSLQDTAYAQLLRLKINAAQNKIVFNCKLPYTQKAQLVYENDAICEPFRNAPLHSPGKNCGDFPPILMSRTSDTKKFNAYSIYTNEILYNI